METVVVEKESGVGLRRKIKAVLCNNPINYFGILFWGCEIPIICQGEDRPILSEDYIKNVLLPIANKQK